ncbi:glutamine--fructose-6-phosphate transaminase [Candidatus Omnitrophus magneticus]|uniref:Glutamine--fructose-6-phosphate aminotransferase [isomerizing] n=1 Tax=Candidatus Omnitrophus magneticus TaxID=1609969 RepID=A0A0F0CR90_9BACT|nr:glutamine--fructose-6-phosphate transaminase [Candidatus Omnitrophus magneticus]
MCGVIGYIGYRNATDVILKGLSRLEYRGYDSAGVAVLADGEIETLKRQGKLAVLKEELDKHPIRGNTGIGHTRWATHGVPNDTNAHPHLDIHGCIAIVHNGIIENYQELKQALQKKGYKFASDTDSETIAHLVSSEYKGDLLEAVKKAAAKLKGSFAAAVIHKGEPGRIVGIRLDSPMVVGLGTNEFFIASDIPAILEYTKNVIYLENGEMVDISLAKGVSIYGLDGKERKKKAVTIKWDISQAEKGGYKHFMLKEIFEQPTVLHKIFGERIKKGNVVFDELAIKPAVFKKIKNIAVVACGTAYHAGLTGKYLLEKVTRIPVWVDQASEFRYRDPIVNKDTLVIVVSQSGETADTLAGLREAKRRGAKVLAICNVLGSTIAREADGVIYTHAGPEIAVASTKAYTAQIAIFQLLTYYIAKERGTVKGVDKGFLQGLKKIPHIMDEMLKEYEKENKISYYATKFHEYYHARNNKSCFLYLARNVNYPNALEGALKLKEISYICAEGYPAGEMKHGPIALIDENPWVVCLAIKSDTYDKMLSNIQEIKARDGIVIAVVSKGDKLAKEKSINYAMEVPVVPEIFSPFLVVVPLQLLAYYVGRAFGYDIDKPRNLAKSVTVE